MNRTRKVAIGSQLPYTVTSRQELNRLVDTSSDVKKAPSATQTTLIYEQTWISSVVRASQPSQLPTWLLLFFQHHSSTNAMEAMAASDLPESSKVPAAKEQTYQPKLHSSLESLPSSLQSSKPCNSTLVRQMATDVAVQASWALGVARLDYDGDGGSSDSKSSTASRLSNTIWSSRAKTVLELSGLFAISRNSPLSIPIRRTSKEIGMLS